MQLSEWKEPIAGELRARTGRRNTAPAIALAALELVRRDPDAIMLVVPADHVVTGQRAFDAAVRLRLRLAEQGHLVTFGIRPTRPETGYGYIKPERKMCWQSGTAQGHPVSGFVEKPNADQGGAVSQGRGLLLE